MNERDDGSPDVGILADLLQETAGHHDSFERNAAEHDWWDWYAPYLDARLRGRTAVEATDAADRYMDDARHVVRGAPRARAGEDQPASSWGRFAAILVGTDGSASSMEAVTFAVELAARQRAQLKVVHVIPPLDVLPADDDDASAVPHEVTERDRAPLEAAAALATAHGVVATTELLAGRTVPEIVSYGDSHQVDLIVVGSSGRGAIADVILGSVSLGVLRKATRPVLVVRGGRTPSSAPSEGC